MTACGCCAGGFIAASNWCARTRAKNEVHGVLMRTLQGKPPCSDMFGVKGRRWLEQLHRQLAVEEAETLESALRQIDFLDSEIDQVERTVAQQMLDSPEAKRLLTVPGVNVIAAATFLAAVGDITRFRDSRKLVAYLGLDPRVRQSGDHPARPGRISKRGSAQARWGLVEAAWSVVAQPGPLRAFYERIKGRRGHGKAIVAAARKLAVLFWCSPTARTTPTSSPPRPARSCAVSRSPPAHPSARSAPSVSGRPTSSCAKQSLSSPSRPRPPTGGWSRTSSPEARREKRART